MLSRSAVSVLLVLVLGCGGPAGSEPAPASSRGGTVAPTAGAEPASETRTTAERAEDDTILAEIGGDTSGLFAAEGELDCTTDGDCTLTTFAGCCAATLCPGDGRAVSRSWSDRQVLPCARVECARRPPEPSCPPAPTVTVACEAGRCVRR